MLTQNCSFCFCLGTESQGDSVRTKRAACSPCWQGPRLFWSWLPLQEVQTAKEGMFVILRWQPCNLELQQSTQRRRKRSADSNMVIPEPQTIPLKSAGKSPQSWRSPEGIATDGSLPREGSQCRYIARCLGCANKHFLPLLTFSILPTDKEWKHQWIVTCLVRLKNS